MRQEGRGSRFSLQSLGSRACDAELPTTTPSNPVFHWPAHPLHSTASQPWLQSTCPDRTQCFQTPAVGNKVLEMLEALSPPASCWLGRVCLISCQAQTLPELLAPSLYSQSPRPHCYKDYEVLARLCPGHVGPGLWVPMRVTDHRGDGRAPRTSLKVTLFVSPEVMPLCGL